MGMCWVLCSRFLYATSELYGEYLFKMIIKKIQELFQLFPVISRDQLLHIIYDNDTSAIRKLNDKLRKLVDRGVLDVNREIKPYVYFRTPRNVHLRSNHLQHHLAIVDFWIWMTKTQKQKLEIEAIEESLGKGLPRPDMTIMYRGLRHFVEIQRSDIAEAKMQKKIEEYEKAMGEKKVKGSDIVWIIAPKVYEAKSKYFRVEYLNTTKYKIKMGAI